MSSNLQFKLIFNNIERTIEIDPERFKTICGPMFYSFVNTKTFQIQYESREEILNSFLQYLKDGTLPSIKLENIYEYDQLNHYFQIKEIQRLIDQVKNAFNDHEKIIELLINPSIKDRSMYENIISQNIDEYLKKVGKELMNLPINILYNIFFQSQTLSDHNLVYQLIIENIQQRHDTTIFVLVQFLDVKHLLPRYLIEIDKNINIFNKPNVDLSYIAKLKRQVFQFPICKNNEINGIVKFLKNQNNGDIPDHVLDAKSKDIYRNDSTYHPKNMFIDDDSTYYASAENIRSSVTFEFKGMKVKLTGYLLKSFRNSSNGYHLRNWVIEAFNKKTGDWDVIHEEKDFE